jgi:outer membrane biosynthesis protein TonB
MVALLALAAVLGSAPPERGEAVSSIDKDAIRKVVRAHIGEVRACYTEGLARKPELRGRLVLHFVVAVTGAVSSSSIASSELDDAKVEQCIAAAALEWHFFGGARIAVSYPFTFTPE